MATSTAHIMNMNMNMNMNTSLLSSTNLTSTLIIMYLEWNSPTVGITMTNSGDAVYEQFISEWR